MRLVTHARDPEAAMAELEAQGLPRLPRPPRCTQHPERPAVKWQHTHSCGRAYTEAFCTDHGPWIP